MTSFKATVNDKLSIYRFPNPQIKLGKAIRSRSAHIWELDNINRVIKVTHDDNKDFIKNFNKLLSYLQKSNNPSIVKVYEFGQFNIGDTIYHFHIMEKLSPPQRTKSEIWIEDILYEFYYNRREVPEFCSANIQEFLSNIKKIKYKYYDLHCGNIMLDKYGRLKLIDLEAFLN